ncbi:MAG: hypothetical protein HZY76_21390 [Anaerolineae bacterium]|nr:MAG: hypothetical protein HZY76_21390 [Anaerolineae bacterium]
MVGAIMLGAMLLAADAATGSGLLSAVTERATSIIDPSASTSGSAANRETRLQAALHCPQHHQPLYRRRLWRPRPVQLLTQWRAQALFRHSSYSWLFYRVGLVQGVFLLGVFLFIAASAAAHPAAGGWARAAALAFLAAFIANLLVGFGNNTVFDFLARS